MPARPPSATGSSPPRSPCATAIIDRWLASERTSHAKGSKRVYYLSLEFLIGRLLSRRRSSNLGLTEDVRAALGDLGVDLDRLRRAEPDAALGNGGLGRLAACFMESMASLGIPAYGYGIRYDHGLFRQVIRDGWQQEFPEDWLSFGNPWEFERPEVAYDIRFRRLVETAHASGRHARSVWHPGRDRSRRSPTTRPIVGWRGRHVNTLRLWSARAVDPLRLDAFNRGDHVGALAEQVARRGDLPDPLSERRDPGRPGTAPAAGIFLRLRLAAGPGAPPSAQSRRPASPAGRGGDPAQRHPSGDRASPS